jgi:MarR family transcriptional regulator, organic hydroperoxide resistance regulator
MTGQSRSEELNGEILECVSDLIGRVIGQADQVARRLGIPVPFIKALHTMDCPMAMKELGKRMHCDPSFVTLVADMLEKRGLARREPHPADRRVKNLVLTDDGLSLKYRLETEIAARMPWNRVLSDDERVQLLALIRKMLGADGQDPGAHPDLTSALVGLDEALVNSLRDPAPQATPDSPPAAAGEVSSAVSNTGVAR